MQPITLLIFFMILLVIWLLTLLLVYFELLWQHNVPCVSIRSTFLLLLLLSIWKKLCITLHDIVHSIVCCCCSKKFNWTENMNNKVCLSLAVNNSNYITVQTWIVVKMTSTSEKSHVTETHELFVFKNGNLCHTPKLN